MAGMEENREFSKTKPLTMTTKSPSFFNRSMTIHHSAISFSRKSYVSSNRNTASTKKWYNSFESTGNSLKGKVRHLRTLFESPKPIYSSLSSSSLSPSSSPHESSSLSSSSPLLSHQSFNRLRPTKSVSSDLKDSWSILDASTIRFPGTEDRVVVYYTSLRGIRRTYEDCYAVRMIFQGFKVIVDERDVSMDVAYRKELLALMGEKNVSLPQVFIRGKHVGGVDVIRQLNETGELRKLLQVLPVKDRRFACNICGDARFLPCSNCCGSRKVFDEDEEVMKRCLDCNENGLIRCPECCV